MYYYIFCVFLFVAGFLYVNRPAVIPGIWLDRSCFKPGLGQLLAAIENMKKPMRWRLAMAKQAEKLHQPCFQVCLPFSPTMVELIDPELVEKVTKTHFDSFEKGLLWNISFQEFLGNGIFNADGEQWKKQRKATTHILATKSLKDITDRFAHFTYLLANELKAGGDKVSDIQKHFFRLTMVSFCASALGVDLTNSEADPLYRQLPMLFDELQQLTALILTQPPVMARIMKWKYIGKIKENVKALDLILMDIISKARAKAAEENKRLEQHHEDNNDEKPKNLIARFISSEDSAVPLAARNVELRDFLLNLMLGGRDTTASALTNLFMVLDKYPEHKARLMEEIEPLVSRTSQDDPIGPHHLSSCVFFDALILETLRVYPSIAINSRVASRDLHLSEGVFIPKGTICAYCPIIMHRMKSVWGEDAELFKPQRWLEENERGEMKLKQCSPYKFLSFHAGPRVCVGRPLAIMEIKLATAILLSEVDIQLVPKQNFTQNISISSSFKYGIQINATPKNK